MAQYRVNTDALRAGADSLRGIQRELGSVAADLALIQVSRALKSSSSVLLSSRIADCNLAALNQSINLGALAGGLDTIAQLYDRNEQNLSDPKTTTEAAFDRVHDIFQWIDDTIPAWPVPRWHRNWPFILVLSAAGVLGPAAASGGIWGAALGAAGVLGVAAATGRIPGSGSVFSGGVNGRGNFLGIPCEGEAGYSLLGYEVKNTGKAEWDLKNGEVGIGIGGSAEVYGARGHASGNIGLLGGEIEGSVGNAAVSGDIGVTLFDEGKFSPSIGAGAKAEVSVLEGKGEVYVGDKNNNVHIKGDGSVLGAEASAEGRVGVITTKDSKTGKVETSYGVKGEVAAEAYIAQGTVSGGVSIFGIDIDIGVTGKAGGVGVKAGGSATTSGVSGEIGAGLGLGAGLKIEIDWSDFDPPSWDDLKWW